MFKRFLIWLGFKKDKTTQDYITLLENYEIVQSRLHKAIIEDGKLIENLMAIIAGMLIESGKEEFDIKQEVLQDIIVSGIKVNVEYENSLIKLKMLTGELEDDEPESYSGI